MSNQTIEYYDLNAEEFIKRTVDADMKYCQEQFMKWLPTDALILDAGCGSGRDSKYFLDHGFSIQAIDASEQMCKMATAYIGQDVDCIRFENMEYENCFDGVWACASLLHIEKKELPEILRKFFKAMKSHIEGANQTGVL